MFWRSPARASLLTCEIKCWCIFLVNHVLFVKHWLKHCNSIFYDWLFYFSQDTVDSKVNVRLLFYVLQPGGSVTIPFSDSGGGDNFFGISYTDSLTSSSTTPLDNRTTSPNSSEVCVPQPIPPSSYLPQLWIWLFPNPSCLTYLNFRVFLSQPHNPLTHQTNKCDYLFFILYEDAHAKMWKWIWREAFYST